MPRELAILVFTLFSVWLWREDNKSRPRLSKALWIPLIWLLLLASRPLSWWSWFLFGIGSSVTSDLNGNAVDRLLYSVLICLSLIVIPRRACRGVTCFVVTPASYCFTRSSGSRY